MTIGASQSIGITTDYSYHTSAGQVTNFSNVPFNTVTYTATPSITPITFASGSANAYQVTMALTYTDPSTHAPSSVSVSKLVSDHPLRHHQQLKS